MSPPTRVGIGPARALAALAAALLAGACGGGQDAGTSKETLGSALVQLTQAAAGSGGAPGAAVTPGAPAAGGGADAAATATLGALLASLQEEGAPGLPALPGGLDAPAESTPSDPDAAYRQQQIAANATAGIADVNDLVQRMPRLATFTPAPSAPKPSGDLVYLRNGTFYRTTAAGGAEALPMADDSMPPVWSPPDDPGRAWTSPDGRHFAFFAGTDAALWMTEAGGGNNHAVSGDNLPPELHEATVSTGGRQQVRLRPGKDYTLVHLPGAAEPLSVLIDDNSYHIHGEGRLRIVHAAAAEKDRRLVAYINGVPVGAPMAYGRANGAQGVKSGQLQIEVRDPEGQVVAALPPVTLADKELKTLFVVGDTRGALSAVPATYNPSQPPGNYANVRVFNAGTTALTVTLDGGKQKLAGDLAGGTIGAYTAVNAVLGVDDRQDMQLNIYSLRTGEQSVAWSPDSRQVAFLGGVDGTVDLYMTTIEGPARAVTDGPLRETNPIWSPDGRRLTWLAEDVLASTFDLYVWDVGAGEPRLVDLAPVRQAAGVAPDAKVFLPKDPVWLDGGRLGIFPKVEFRSMGVWVADAASGQVQGVYRDPVDAPVWSAAAGAWAFNTDETTGKIVVLTPDGKATTVIENGGHFPLWSPDGRELSYVEGERISTQGWRLHVVGAGGANDRVLSDWWPLVQVSPPVPGANAKRYWLEGGKVLLFSRVGQDYGAAERSGIGQRMVAGPDIENFYTVRTDRPGGRPAQLSDMTQVFYLDQVNPSPRGDALAFVGLWYASRAQQLWTIPAAGGKSVQIDGPVRWYAWVR